MEEPVTIVDRDVLKVLAVDTRMDILKELSYGSRTPSDLSKTLGKSDSTIVEHLDALVRSGLVKKIEQPGKKWIFYTLTERGQGILSSKSKRLIIILGISALSIAGGFFSLSKYLSQTLGITKQVSDATSRALESQAAATPQAIATTIAPVIISSTYLYVAIFLFMVGLSGMMFYLIQKHKQVTK